VNVAIIGTGYVGLVTGACLASLGHRVVCVDVRQDVVDTVNRGEAPFFEAGLPELIKAQLAAGRFAATTDLASAVTGADITCIAVGTPSTAHGIDLSYVTSAAALVGDALRSHLRRHVVVVKSTVIPGSTDGAVRDALFAHAGPAAAARVGLCANPEFLREGSAVSDFLTPDRIVIGESDEEAGSLVASLYESFTCPIVRTSIRNAELIKYTSNSLLALLVSFSNEIASLCEAIPGADADTVMDGVHLDRRLTMVHDGLAVRPEILSFLRGGSGFGGSCLPKDVTALRAFARTLGVATPMLDATVDVNNSRPGQIVDLVERAVGGLNGRTIAVLGVAFKAGTDDLRESAALKVIEQLRARGAGEVRAYDPAVSPNRAGQVEAILTRTPMEAVVNADAVVIATAWPEFRELDWGALAQAMRAAIVVDGRNALSGVSLPPVVRYIKVGTAANTPLAALPTSPSRSPN